MLVFILKIYIYIYIYIYVSLLSVVEGNPKASFWKATTPRCRGGCYSFPWIASLILDSYLTMLNGGIKYHFFKVFGMTQPGIKPQSPEPLANTLTTMPMGWYIIKREDKKRRCPWCNGYRCRKLTQRHEFKSWTILIAFHIALLPLGKVWIQLL